MSITIGNSIMQPFCRKTRNEDSWRPACFAVRPADSGLRFLSLVTLLAALLASSAHGGRPLTVDAAAPVAQGQFELEAGVRYEGLSDARHYEVPFSLAYGLVRTLEVGIGFGGQIEEREELQDHWSTESGVGDLTLGAKWNPLPEEDYCASHTLVCRTARAEWLGEIDVAAASQWHSAGRNAGGWIGEDSGRTGHARESGKGPAAGRIAVSGSG
jgi:hypothetical protein